MSRVTIYRFQGDGIDESQLLALLNGAGCEVIEDDSASDEDTEGETASKTSADALIVILTPELLDDEGLEQKLVDTVAAQCRIVCVWPSGATAGTAPACVDKYSTDQVIWDEDRVRRAVTGQGEPQYDAPTGEPRPRPITTTNICR